MTSSHKTNYIIKALPRKYWHNYEYMELSNNICFPNKQFVIDRDLKTYSVIVGLIYNRIFAKLTY